MKKHLLTIILAISSLALTGLAYADINAQQKKVLEHLNLEDYIIIEENPSYTILSTPVGFLSFIGQTTNFTTEKIYSINPQTGKIQDIVAQKFVADVAPDKDKYVNVKAPKEIGHAYVVYSLSCPYCRKIFQNIEKFKQAGLSLTFVPFVDPDRKDDINRQSYILNQPADKRFEVMSLSEINVPKSPDINDLVNKASYIMEKFNIYSYPLFFTDNGFTANGYQDPEKIIKIIKDR